MAQSRLLFRIVIFMLLIFVMSLTVVPTLAQTITASLAPVWRPGTQLDTVPVTDIRYVDVELHVTANVQFWAADFVCAVKPTVLGDYAWDNTGVITPADTGDNVPMVRWGGDWGGEGAQFVSFPSSGAYTAVTGDAKSGNGFVDAVGDLNFSATRLGNIDPIGKNGVTYNTLVATLRFQVKTLPVGKLSDTSDILCKVVQLLDRNGVKVATPTIAKPAMLNVIDGYTISGTVLYQAQKAHLNIGVECGLDAATPDKLTLTTGAFTYTTRNLGTYTCTFYGNKTNTAPTQEDDMFLAGTTTFNLNSSSYTLLPVTLRGGNTATSGGTETINATDYGNITANWESVVAGVIAANDVNADLKLNELDLAIIGGNFGLSETVDYSHMIFGLPRDYFVLSNGRLWFGDPRSGEVKSLVTNKTDSKNPDFWPTLSPDGGRVAFVRYDSKLLRYYLYTAETKVLPAATVKILTPTATFKQDAFAPSWSPDSQRIAFICGTTTNFSNVFPFDPDSGWGLNQANLCVIESDGRNFRQLTFDNTVKVFPPAWFNNNVVIFAGSATNATCPNDLCYYDFSRNAFGVVDTDVATGPNIADMPVIQTTGVGTHLFYRFDDTATEKIRVAIVTYDGTNFNDFATGAFPGLNHVNVALTLNGTPISTNVDYYDVSPQLQIVYYEFGSSNFQNTDNEGFGDWETPQVRYVDGYVGNPSWDEDPTTPTALHALRATIDWVP